MSQRAGPPGWVTGAVALAAAMVVTSAGAARAQSGSSTLSGFSQGFNGGLSTIQGAVNVSTRDANGNLTIVDGVTQIGSDQSMFAKVRQHHRRLGRLFGRRRHRWRHRHRQQPERQRLGPIQHGHR